METDNIITGATEAEVWAQIEKQLNDDFFDYELLIKQGDREILLTIDIDPGGGFESGSEFTQLRSVLRSATGFKFAIHDDSFIDDIGKFFGMQDVEVGFPELDEHLIIKTNDEEKARAIFADADIREVFTWLDDFDCGIHNTTDDDTDQPISVLEVNVNAGVIETPDLQKLYHAFNKLIAAIEQETLVN